MRMRGWMWMFALLLSFSLALAQEAKKEEPKAPPSLTDVLHRQLSQMENEFVSTAEAMPAEKFNFAPTQGEFKGVRDYATQIKHVAAVHYIVGSAILGEKPPADIGEGENGPAALKTKDEVMKYLKDSFAYAHKAAGSVNEKNATAWIPSPFGSGQTTRLAMATILVGHGFNHYGQMVVYLRMNGIVPPPSRPQPQR